MALAVETHPPLITYIKYRERHVCIHILRKPGSGKRKANYKKKKNKIKGNNRVIITSQIFKYL